VQLHAITQLPMRMTYFGKLCHTLPTRSKHRLKLQNSQKESILKCNSLKNNMKHGIFHETFHSVKNNVFLGFKTQVYQVVTGGGQWQHLCISCHI